MEKQIGIRVRRQEQIGRIAHRADAYFQLWENPAVPSLRDDTNVKTHYYIAKEAKEYSTLGSFRLTEHQDPAFRVCAPSKGSPLIETDFNFV